MTPARLLLIDDEPAIGALIRRVAQWCDYDVTVTTEASEFKHAYGRLLPDVVAIDLAMPGVDGIEILRYLSELDCKAKILIVSGFDRRIRETAMRLGAALGLNMAGIIAKPMRLEELRGVFTGLKSSP